METFCATVANILLAQVAPPVSTNFQEILHVCCHARPDVLLQFATKLSRTLDTWHITILFWNFGPVANANPALAFKPDTVSLFKSVTITVFNHSI